MRDSFTDNCRTSGAPELLRSAIENVVRNAVRYTAKKTTVEIKLRKLPIVDASVKRCKITARNFGMGVPSESLSHLFIPSIASPTPETVKAAALVWVSHPPNVPFVFMVATSKPPTRRSSELMRKVLLRLRLKVLLADIQQLHSIIF